jgi:2-polyprenyl-6-methoxyphenol hydroxylase-like FAD-dependent oxidoreductase
MTLESAEIGIIGAGPTGLTLAIALVRAGLRPRVFERLSSRNDKSRAIVVHARSLEILQQLGLADQFLRAGRFVEDVEVFCNKRKTLGAHLRKEALKGTRFPGLLLINQAKTEEILANALAALGCEIAYGQPISMIEQHRDRIVVRGDSSALEVKYLVGCDGAHSAVRHSLNLAFDGGAYPQTNILADVELDWDAPPTKVHLLLEDSGFMAIFPLVDCWRIVASTTNEVPAAPEPTLAEVQDLLDSRSPFKVKASNPRWVTRFKLHHRIIPSYRVNSIFLAGDAAHIHSPVGGQGMNTGIQDAWNLGWKLAAAVRQPAAAEILLDSYHQERHPVGMALIRTTDRMFTAVAGTSSFSRFLRSMVAPLATRAVNVLPLVKNTALYRISQLGIRYGNSNLNDPDPYNDYFNPKTPVPGSRLPDIANIHDKLDLKRATVIAHSQLPITDPSVVSVDFPTADLLGIERGGCLLVRPDAHVAARAPDIEMLMRSRVYDTLTR